MISNYKKHLILIFIILMPLNVFSSEEEENIIPLVDYFKVNVDGDLLPESLKDIKYDRISKILFDEKIEIRSDNSTYWNPSELKYKHSIFHKIYIISDNTKNINIYETGNQKIIKSSGSHDFDDTAIMSLEEIQFDPLPETMLKYGNYIVILQIQNSR